MAAFIRTEFGWQAQVARRVDDKSFRKAKTFKSKREAQVWAREIEVEVYAGTDSHATLHQVFDRYEHERSNGKKGERWEVIRLAKFGRETVSGKPVGEDVISDVTTADLVAWRDARLKKVKPASVRREMSLLKHVFVVAHEDWELIRVNPMTKVKRPPQGKRRKRRVYSDEIDALSIALDLYSLPWVSEKHITGAAFLFAIETGMRAGEILEILNRRVEGLVVHLLETKNDHARDVLLTNRALEILKAVRGDRLGPNQRPFDIDADSRDSRFRAAVKKARIEDLHFHDSRHEAVTRLAKRFKILKLARVIGHKNLNELMTYYEASGANLAEELNASISNDEIK